VGSVLIAPVRIGPRAVVGAGSVVTRGRNVKTGQVVAGVPAREITKKRKTT
jgi:bifunctional UDP-N-acetylglucosamine pyrophosphorylase / glucosamine-1-phosphate N-acetyltransferase